MKFARLILPVFSLGVILYAFFFVEETRKDQTEIIYWRENFSSIKYSPDSGNIPEYSKFFKFPMTLKKIERGLTENPIFIVSSSDLESGKEFQYEGNYNIKNFFSESSALKVKSVNASTPELLSKLQISTSTSPSFAFYSKDKLIKKIYLGEENSDKSQRFLLFENEVLSSFPYIFSRFQYHSETFREKQLVHLGESNIQKIEFLSDELNLEIVNYPKRKENTFENDWRKTDGKKLDPSLSMEFENSIRGLNIEIFPDSENGQGFPVANSLTEGRQSKSLKYNAKEESVFIRFYTRTDIKGKVYIPITREVVGLYKSSPAYILESSLIQFINTLNKIKTAPEWKEPSKNIKR